MPSTYLTRTSTAGNRQKFTTSFWFKLAKADSTRMSFFSATETTDGGEISYMRVDDKIWIREAHSNNSDLVLETNRLFRDVNSWYHIVFTVDTTQATNTNRVKIYVNGVQETSFASATYPSQNYNTRWNESGQVMQIGRNVSAYPYYFDGSISHFHHCDGYAYDASAFGETDATTGEWKIKTSPSVTYGNNGFFILKDGNSVTDASTNSNNFTVAGGTLTKTEDNPSNVFATLNPLHLLGIPPRSGTFSYGNTKCADANSNWQGCVGTIGSHSGKWYWEYQLVGGTYHMPGIVPDNGNFSQSGIYTIDYGGMGYSAYVDNGTIRARFNNSDISGWNTSGMGNTSFSSNDIINIAVDMDNKFMYIGKNGTWFKSGDPTSGSTGTGGINISATFTSGVFMLPAFSNYNGTTGQFNFGNGYMGTTAVSSAGTNASGNGIFEYDVPTGYTALSTKGLNL